MENAFPGQFHAALKLSQKNTDVSYANSAPQLHLTVRSRFGSGNDLEDDLKASYGQRTALSSGATWCSPSHGVGGDLGSDLALERY